MSGNSRIFDDNDGSSIVRSIEAIGQHLTALEAVVGAPTSAGTTAAARRMKQKSAAPSFAAAVSSTPPSAAAETSFHDADAMASAPLLGAVRQGHLTELSPRESARFSLGSSSQSARKKPARKRLSLKRTKKEGSRSQKSRGIPKAIRNPLKNVSSKLATVSSKVMRLGKKSSTAKKQLPAPPTPTTYHLKCDSSNSSHTSGSPVSPVTNAKGTAEPSYPDDSCQEAADLLPRKLEEDFSSISPSLSSLSNTSSCSEGYRTFLNIVNASRCPFDAFNPPSSDTDDHACSPPQMPDMDDQGDDSHSIPSLFNGLEVFESDEGLEVVVYGGGSTNTPIPQVTTDNEEAADSVLAWGCLTALLGAPAPQSVLKEKRKKRTPVNLWQDGVADGDLDCILPGDALAQETPQETQVLSQEEANRFTLNQTLHKIMSRKEEGKAAWKSDAAWTARAARKVIERPAFSEQLVEVRKDSEIEDDACSIPSVRSVDARVVVCNHSGNADIVVSDGSWNAKVIVCDQSSFVDDDRMAYQVPQVCDTMHATQDVTNVNGVADSALMWGCMTALLGSPAPKSVLLGGKKRQRRTPVNLWQGDAAVGDLDDIISLSKYDDLDESDNCSIPSLSGEEVMMDVKETDLPPEIVEQDSVACDDESESSSMGELSIDLHELRDADDNDACFNTSVNEKDGVEEGADFALAWGALGMLLGSPAPKSVSKNKRASAVLWDSEGTDTDGLDTVPSIEIDEDDIGSISSVKTEDPLDDSIIRDLEEFVLANESSASLEHDTNGKEDVNSIMAWSALTALLGAPAPPSIVGKKPRQKGSIINLWDNGEAMDEDLDDLISFTQDHGSCEDINKASKENTQQVDLNVQPVSQKSTEQDVDHDTHSMPSLTASFADDDSSDSSPLTLQ